MQIIIMIIFFIVILINAPAISMSGSTDYRGKQWDDIAASCKQTKKEIK